MKVRKISMTKTGAMLMNIAGFIPKEWEYVEVETVKSTKETVIIKLSLLKARENEPTVSEKVS